jgi:hypothetical protein
MCCQTALLQQKISISFHDARGSFRSSRPRLYLETRARREQRAQSPQDGALALVRSPSPPTSQKQTNRFTVDAPHVAVRSQQPAIKPSNQPELIPQARNSVAQCLNLRDVSLDEWTQRA